MSRLARRVSVDGSASFSFCPRLARTPSQKNSSRESDWNKRLQLYVGENQGRFPASIEELATAFNVPVPKLPPGAYLSIDRTNKVVRLRGL